MPPKLGVHLLKTILEPGFKFRVTRIVLMRNSPHIEVRLSPPPTLNAPLMIDYLVAQNLMCPGRETVLFGQLVELTADFNHSRLNSLLGVIPIRNSMTGQNTKTYVQLLKELTPDRFVTLRQLLV
jgi:hypothetical protein